MTINTLEVFLTVVEEMSFTRAAQRLFITQQSLSGHIRRLEEEYGVILFERKPKLRLTADGENMAFYAAQILRTQNEMVRGFADLSTRRTADLGLGISYMRSTVFSAGIWDRFHRMHPNIQVHLTEANTHALLEQLQRGEIALMIGVDIQPLPGLRVIPLIRESLCCLADRQLYTKCCGKDIAETGSGRTITLRELSSMPLMLPPRGNRLRTAMERMFRNTGTRPRVLLESDRQDVLHRLVCEGEGAGILSPMVMYDTERKELMIPENCCLFGIREAGVSTVSAALLSDTQLPHYAEEMIGVIRNVFSEYEAALEKLYLQEDSTEQQP